MEEDESLAADHYREQIQERHHKEVYLDRDKLMKGSSHIRKVFPGSFINEKLPIDLLHEVFLEQGIDGKLTLSEIESLIRDKIKDENHPLRSLVVEKKTKFDSFLTHQVATQYINEIEKACEKLDLDIRGGVSVGLIQRNEIQAEQQTVFLTECSVVNITGNLYLLAHRAAKLLAKSIAFEFVGGGEYQLSSNIEDYKDNLLTNEELQRQWDFFFVDCAYNPNSPPLGEVVCLGELHVQNCFIDMNDAMMVFIIGHEVGHHICKHSLNGKVSASDSDVNDSYLMEHEADIVASRLTMQIGRRAEEFNLFASCNLGAFCILTIFEFLKKGYGILNTGAEFGEFQPNGTHPPTKDRLGVINAYIEHYEYDEQSAALALRLMELFSELLEFIWSNSSIHLRKLHAAGFRSEQVENSQWLP